MQQGNGPARDPVAVRSSEGEARWWVGALAVIKATAADTGGQVTIVEVTEPPGGEAPLHVHHRESSTATSPSRSAARQSRLEQATTPSARARSRTATWSATRAAACYSSARPAASRTP